MGKLFSVDLEKPLVYWPKVKPIMRSSRKRVLENVEIDHTEDAIQRLRTTYDIFKKAFIHNIKGESLSRRDTKQLIAMYIYRDVVNENYSSQFDDFLLIYISDNIHRCLEYCITLFLYTYSKAKNHIIRLGYCICGYIKNSKLEDSNRWKRNEKIFSIDPYKYIFSVLQEVNYEYEELLEYFGFTEESYINSPFMKTCVVEIYKSREIPWHTKVGLLENIFSDTRYESILAHCVNAMFRDKLIYSIIHSKRVDQNSGYISVVLTYLMKRWGDPRGNNFTGGNWSLISPEIQNYFRFIFAKDALDLFFAITDELNLDTNWRYRKKFWEAYLPYISRTHTLLSEMGSIKARRLNKNDDEVQLHFGNLSSSQKSVFILQIQHIILVEWSDNGKLSIITTCSDRARDHIFSLEKCSETDLKEYLKTLSEEQIAHLSPHNYNWQNKVRKILFSKLGINPTKSYDIYA